MSSSPKPRYRSARGALIGSLVLLALGVPGCRPADLLAEVRQLQATGRFEQSVEPLRRLMETRGDDPEVNLLYGVALARTGRPSLAFWPLQKAMLSPDWTARAGTQMVLAATAAGNYDVAIDAASQVLEAEPDSSVVMVMRANARVSNRTDYELAIADADRALEIDPDNFEALVPKAVALLGLERPDEAAAVLGELDQRFREESLGLESSGIYCAASASLAKERGELEEAERRYDECLERFPSMDRLVSGAVEFFDAQGRTERSNEILRAALAEDPGRREYRSALAVRYERLGRVDEAESVLREGTELEHPAELAAAWRDLAGFYAAHDRKAEGIEAFEEVLALGGDPEPGLLFDYADALVIAGRYDEALEVSERMTVPAHRALVRGRIQLLRGENEQALASFSEGLRLWPNNAVAHYYAAVAAERVGEIDRAIEEYRYSMRASPESTDSRLRLARLHAAEGEPALAVAALQHEVGEHAGALENALLELQLFAELGLLEGVPPPRLAQTLGQPGVRGRAVGAWAKGAWKRAGPEAALAVLRGADRLDLHDSANAPALEQRVRALVAVGEPAEALAAADASLAASPNAAIFHAIRGLALEGGGAPAADVEAVYRRALELGDSQAVALVGLAALRAGDGATDEALSLYERADAATPADPSAAHAAVALLDAADRRPEMEARLERLLDEYPYDGRAALRLAELRIERGAPAGETRALLRLAARFGAPTEADALEARMGGEAQAVEAPDAGVQGS